MTDEALERIRATYSRVPTGKLLEDAAVLAWHAAGEPANDADRKANEKKWPPRETGPVEKASARSSILTSAFALESAANSCLERGLRLPKRVAKRVDQFTPLEKFELFLHEAFGVTLDRGRSDVQRVAEVLKLRNGAAHPRPVDRDTEILQRKGSTGQLIHPDFGPKTQLLQIYEARDQWRAEDAAKVLGAVVEFLDRLLLVDCRLSASQAAELLVSRLRDERGRDSVIICDLWEVAFYLRKYWGLRFELFSIVYPEQEARGAYRPGE